jgi:hypothetical protein
MLHNATLADLFGSTEAMLLLALFVFVPGYVAGWLTNVLRFREQKLSMRLLLSTPLAIAIVPITADLAGRYPPLLWALFAAVWAMFAVLLFQEIRSGGGFKMSREIRIGAIIVAAWAILALASLVDLQWGNQVYFSSSAYDHSVRTAMVAAASRSIPPTNPFRTAGRNRARPAAPVIRIPLQSAQVRRPRVVECADHVVGGRDAMDASSPAGDGRLHIGLHHIASDSTLAARARRKRRDRGIRFRQCGWPFCACNVYVCGLRGYLAADIGLSRMVGRNRPVCCGRSSLDHARTALLAHSLGTWRRHHRKWQRGRRRFRSFCRTRVPPRHAHAGQAHELASSA